MKKESTGSTESHEAVAENEMSDSSLPTSQHEHEGGDSMDESDCEKHFANQGNFTFCLQDVITEEFLKT